jgi:hypothetical protein
MIILFILLLFLIRITVQIEFNLSYFSIKIFKFNFYKKYYKDIKNIEEERRKVSFIKIFKLIDIQTINLSIEGFNNYYYKALNYGIINYLFYVFSFMIKDQFIFNYNLKDSNKFNLNFQCIIKSNIGKIIIGLLKRSKVNERTSNK